LKAGAAWLRGGVARFFSRKILVTKSSYFQTCTAPALPVRNLDEGG